MSARTEPETVLDSLERRVGDCDAKLADYLAQCHRGVPVGHSARRPWSVLVEGPTLGALCVLARAAMQDLEDLSPEERAAVEVLS